MNILMLTPYLPYPPSSGGQIRSYNLIKQLSKKHDITLCALVKSRSEEKYAEQMKKYCRQIYTFRRTEKLWSPKSVLKTGFSPFPFVVIRNYSPEEKRKVKELVEKEDFNLIHAETFYVCPYIPKTKIPVVLVDQTIEYQVYQHFVKTTKLKPLVPLFLIDVLKIKYWEAFYWKRARGVVAVSERDARVMKSVVKGLDVTVVPNGVGEDLSGDVPLHFNKNILFMGNYAWMQNIEAAQILAKEIFPEIQKKVPDAKLFLVGQNTDRISKLKSEDVEMVDLKIEDIEGVRKYYRESGCLVAPLHGPGGTRLKILGAMAAKLPVVTTLIGIEGIDAKNNESVLIGNSSAEIADLVAKLLEDKILYEKIVKNARELVDKKYTYEAIAEKLDRVYQEVVR